MSDDFEKPAYPGDRLVWVPEISERANVRPVTVYKWFSNGTLPCCQLGGRRGVWLSDLLAAMQPKKKDAA